MKCPIDGNDLLLSERQGVEIDYCPSCRGVWLDRGELDKLIDRSMAALPSDDRPRDDRAGEDRHRRNDRYQRDDRHESDPRYRGKKKSSWLGDFFEFGD